MNAVHLVEVLGKLKRPELLRIAREGRNEGLVRPLFPLNQYDTAALRRLLRRSAHRLLHLPSVQEALRRYATPSSQPAEPSSASLPSLPQLVERLFPGVYGMYAEKERLIERLYLPLAYPRIAERYGLSLSPTLLVMGPPGTGKSFLLKRFIQGTGFWGSWVAAPSLANKWYGETERHLRRLAKIALKNRPALLVLDEIDGLFVDRSKNLPWLNGATLQMLTLLDTLKEQGGVGVVLLTNHKDFIDPALLRSERIDEELYIPLPDLEERYQILVQASRKLPLAPDIDWRSWAERTEGYSRADLIQLLKKAGQRAFLAHFREGKPQQITEIDLRRAISE
ncbi:MAG: hypothetical protein KatS3mg026_0379 [Bacteroidia bacterium]|nr:MAG: hypothetical protein KatS3mg026_0379 [Bacteroidia bacterium]